MALSGCVPFVGSAPLHDPDAVQEPALLLFQVKVALPPETTEGTFVVKVSAGAGGVDEPPPPPPPPPLAHALPLKTAAGEPADKNYLTNADFDFTLSYPSDLSVQEYDEGEGTRSVVFQNANEQVGFEMFITPDPADDPLTLEDIKLDFPTLETARVQSLTVGTGTPAIAFTSAVPDFGPTADLWFTHNGYFEIVTYPNLGSRLKQIIDTIRFP